MQLLLCTLGLSCQSAVQHTGALRHAGQLGFNRKLPRFHPPLLNQGSTEINSLPPGSSKTKREALGKWLASRRGFPIRPKALLGPGRGLSAALSRPETGGEAQEGQPEVTMGRDPLSPGQQPALTLFFYFYFIWEEN